MNYHINKFFQVAAFWFVVMTRGWADLPKDPVGYLAWQKQMIELVERHRANPQPDTIPALGHNLWRLGLSTNREKGEPVVRRAFQEALLSIPGHAEYYGKQIKAAEKDVVEALQTVGLERAGTAKARLLRVQTEAFGTLEALPSPETVRVLGELLDDPWGFEPGMDRTVQAVRFKTYGESPHSGMAMIALARLPLETRANNTPANKISYDADIGAWTLWYEQIRAGTRTFRFIGDPQEYSLAGPVPQAKIPVPISTPANAMQNVEPVRPETRKEISFVPVAAAVAVLILAILIAARRKNQARKL